MNGEGCTCAARYSGECCCDADWAEPVGIQNISYEKQENSYDQYTVIINGKTIHIPVVGNINPDQEIRLCQILQSLIDKENLNE